MVYTVSYTHLRVPSYTVSETIVDFWPVINDTSCMRKHTYLEMLNSPPLSFIARFTISYKVYYFSIPRQAATYCEYVRFNRYNARTEEYLGIGFFLVHK